MADKLDKTSKVWKKEEEGGNIRGWVSEYKKRKEKKNGTLIPFLQEYWLILFNFSACQIVLPPLTAGDGYKKKCEDINQGYKDTHIMHTPQD